MVQPEFTISSKRLCGQILRALREADEEFQRSGYFTVLSVTLAALRRLRESILAADGIAHVREPDGRGAGRVVDIRLGHCQPVTSNDRQASITATQTAR